MPLERADLSPSERKENERRHLFIGVVGPMGSGKTTLSNLMVSFLSVPDHEVIKHEEKFEDNPQLRSFYDNPSKFSYPSQEFFLRSKVSQLGDIGKCLQTQTVIIDPSLEMDRVFARTQKEMGWMTKEQYQEYEKLQRSLVKDNHIPEPDIFIVVNATPDIIRKRVIERGRDFELQMVKRYPDYFNRLCKGVEDFARNTRPVIRIDSGTMDFVHTPHGKWQAVNEVMYWMDYHFNCRNERFGSDGGKLIIPSYL